MSGTAKRQNQVAAVLWRRLNADGSDAMRLWRNEDGWLIAGSAVFLEEGQVAELAYQVNCDAAWRTRGGSVNGHVGGREIAIDVRVSATGEWTCNGRRVPGVAGCVDLDLNFTPATNLITFRRLRMAVGERAEVPVAWLKLPEFELQRLPQTIARRDESHYDYAAATVGYAGILRVDAAGVVLDYPGLWAAVAREKFDEE